MRSRSRPTVSDPGPAFTIHGEVESAFIEANGAARDLLGFSRDAELPAQISQLIASLTGRTFAEEITSLRSTSESKLLPALLLGAGYRVIPAMLACRLAGGAVMVEPTEVGCTSVLSRGMVDATALAHAAVDIAPGAIITTDELGTILSINAAAEIAFGYSAEELAGRNVAMLMNAQDAAAHDDHLRRYFRTGERRIIGAMRVVDACRRSGETFPVELYVGEVSYGDRRLYVGFLRDISRRRQLQAETTTLQRELIHVTRLASMGEMAAALAHELNQPLTAITAYAEAARANLSRSGEPAADAVRDNLAKAAAQAMRAGEVIRRMRQLASGGVGQRHPEDLNAIVREAVALAAIGANALGIETSIVEDQSTPLAICDRIQIQQVIINLVRNAIDAFADAATGASHWSQRKLIAIETYADHRHATVSVRDNGPGVPAKLRERLFESFLTTKALGVGLGLPISRMIIESHGGRLWLESGDGEGAEFRFTLPLETIEPPP
jgi:two-component system sensor kinase FixL